jgi:hypothetical protein
VILERGFNRGRVRQFGGKLNVPMHKKAPAENSTGAEFDDEIQSLRRLNAWRAAPQAGPAPLIDHADGPAEHVDFLLLCPRWMMRGLYRSREVSV